MSFRYAGLFLFFSVTLGCGAKYELAVPHPQDFKSYVVGEISEANVGEAFVLIEAGEGLDVFEVAEPFRPPNVGPNVFSEWPTGKLLPQYAVSTEDPDEWFLIDPDTEIWISIFSDGRVKRGWVLPFSGENVPQGEWPSGYLFRRARNAIRTEGGFRAELVYSGVSSNTLRVAYREYSDDMARPAFSQELQYDLSEDRIITFRSLRIEVLEAGNSSLRFRVLDDGGLPWLPRR